MIEQPQLSRRPCPDQFNEIICVCPVANIFMTQMGRGSRAFFIAIFYSTRRAVRRLDLCTSHIVHATATVEHRNCTIIRGKRHSTFFIGSAAY